MEVLHRWFSLCILYGVMLNVGSHLGSLFVTPEARFSYRGVSNAAH